MDLEEVVKRLEFLEFRCRHGVWVPDFDQTLRCTRCGAPIDHQPSDRELADGSVTYP